MSGFNSFSDCCISEIKFTRYNCLVNFYPVRVNEYQKRNFLITAKTGSLGNFKTIFSPQSLVYYIINYWIYRQNTCRPTIELLFFSVIVTLFVSSLRRRSQSLRVSKKAGIRFQLFLNKKIIKKVYLGKYLLA